jgi:hypothetical protein
VWARSFRPSFAFERAEIANQAREQPRLANEFNPVNSQKGGVSPESRFTNADSERSMLVGHVVNVSENAIGVFDLPVVDMV